MSYPGYPPMGYTPFPGYPADHESSFLPPVQYPYPSGFLPMGGGAYPPAPSGSYLGAGGYTTPGGYPAPGGYPVTPSPGGQGFGAPPGGPPAQPYGGRPAQVPVPGGFPGGQMPSHYPGGQAPYPSQPASMTQGSQRTIRPASYFDAMRDAESLCKAMKSFGTDEQAIVDVVSSRSNDQRQQIKAALKTMYGKDLIKDLKSELSGNMEELILALSMPSTYYDAWSLRKAIQGAGTQERVLIEILCTRTNQEIQDTVRYLEKDIKLDTSGHFELLMFICQGNCDENQSVNHQMAQDNAQRLYQASEGKLGTDESCFNMILATRSFPQLKASMEAYSRMFCGYIQSGLKTVLQCDLNHLLAQMTPYYRKLLLAIVGQ
uniref:Annexin n=1 Tax=Cricetulus griseus TaxID=10029 RepID=A0A8C2QIA8_CRIGR